MIHVVFDDPFVKLNYQGEEYVALTEFNKIKTPFQTKDAKRLPRWLVRPLKVILKSNKIQF